jgi:transglutaminase-like putative cysteine protease
MLQSDDPAIVEMANGVASDQTDPWKVACALEHFVKDTIQLKNYSKAMATAAEVARTREGDCTEHAMLLAALCRARGIPARVAIGLVYYPPVQGFAYHMWTEAWVRDRWVPLDATLGLGGIGAAHLKLSQSSLKGSSAFAEMLPVVQAIGRLELRVVSAEY